MASVQAPLLCRPELSFAESETGCFCHSCDTEAIFGLLSFDGQPVSARVRQSRRRDSGIPNARQKGFELPLRDTRRP